MLSWRIHVVLKGIGATKIRSIVGAGLLLLAGSVSLFAQGSEGRISGTITDQSGAAVPGAKVTVTDEQRNVSRVLTTDSSGSYAAPNLIASTYDVHVEFQGFKSSDRKNLVLDVAQDLRVDVSLQTGEQTETVVVTAEAAALNTSNAELGGTIENKVINDLPLNGRNFEN